MGGVKKRQRRAAEAPMLTKPSLPKKPVLEAKKSKAEKLAEKAKKSEDKRAKMGLRMSKKKQQEEKKKNAGKKKLGQLKAKLANRPEHHHDDKGPAPTPAPEVKPPHKNGGKGV